MAGGEKLPKNPEDNYYEAHWGIEPKKKWTVKDSDLPSPLVEMGKLIAIHLEDGTDIFFGPGNHLVYTTTADTRLYCVLTQAAQKRIIKEFWDPKDHVEPLSQVAKFTGGRQARYPHADVLVQNLGLMIDIEYQCAKGSYEEGEEPDGPSLYVHRFGELSEGGGILPMVSIDQFGRIWIVAGSYKVLRGGITG